MVVCDVFRSESLLEVDLERAFGRGNFGFEPSTVILDSGHRIRFTTCDIENGVRVCPGDKEADYFILRLLSRSVGCLRAGAIVARSGC